MTIDVPSDVFDSISLLVGYLYGDEEKHWRENDQPAGHVFPHIERIDAWLQANQPKPF